MNRSKQCTNIMVSFISMRCLCHLSDTICKQMGKSDRKLRPYPGADLPCRAFTILQNPVEDGLVFRMKKMFTENVFSMNMGTTRVCAHLCLPTVHEETGPGQLLQVQRLYLLPLQLPGGQHRCQDQSLPNPDVLQQLQFP
jgi:hypothetical protein